MAGGVIYVTITVITAALLWGFRHQWAEFYAPINESVRDSMLETLPYFILGCLLIDGL